MTLHTRLLALLAALALALPAPSGRAAAPPRPRIDRYGDPLPPGAVARLGTVRLRHGGWVNGVAFSPDGRLLASAGHDDTVRLWDPRTGKQVRAFRCQPDDWVWSPAFSPDGKWLASATRSAGVRVWGVATGRVVRRLGKAPEPCRCIAFSPDGKWLAAGMGKAVRLWRLPAWSEAAHLEGPSANVWCLAFSPDGKRLACGEDNSVRVWDPAKGKRLLVCRHSEGVKAVAFSPDGKTIASGGPGDRVALWDARTGKRLARFPRSLPVGWGSGISALRFSPDGKQLASAGPGHLTVRDVATGKKVYRLGPRELDFQDVAFSPDGKALACAAGCAVLLRDAATGRALLPARGSLEAATAVAFSPDGRRVAVGERGDFTRRTSSDWRARDWDHGVGGALLFYDAATPRLLRRVDAGQTLIGRVAFGPGGKGLVSEDAYGTLRFWDARSGRFLRVWPKGPPYAVYGTGFTTGLVRTAPDLKSFVCYSTGGGWRFKMDPEVRVLESATGKELGKFSPPVREFRAVSFAPDGKALALGSRDGLVWVCRLADGKSICRLGEEGKRVVHVGFAPVGKVVASADGAGAFTLWELATGRRRAHFLAHPSDLLLTPFRFALSPDGRTLATWTGGEAVYLWDGPTGKQVKRLDGHRGPVTGVAFSPDGRVLASASEDTTVLLWDLPALLRGAPDRTPPGVADLDRLWAGLAGADAPAAYRAMCALAAAGGPTVAHARKRLRPAEVLDARRVRGLVAELGSEEFAVRERATGELEGVIEQVAPALRNALADKPPLEVHRRLERLLRLYERPQLRRHDVRALRAVEVLEIIGTPEARAVLERLAGGAEQARLTREAKSALARLEGRGSTAGTGTGKAARSKR